MARPTQCEYSGANASSVSSVSEIVSTTPISSDAQTIGMSELGHTSIAWSSRTCNKRNGGRALPACNSDD